MGNRGSFKTHIDGKALLKRIQQSGYSIRSLANEPEICRTEKTIRNAIKTDEIPVELLYKICRVLGTDMKDFTVAEVSDGEHTDRDSSGILRNYTYLKLLLTAHGLSMSDFQSLKNDRKYELIADLERGIQHTLCQYFPGNNIEYDLHESRMEDMLKALEDENEEYRIINRLSTMGFMNLGFDDYAAVDAARVK